MRGARARRSLRPDHRAPRAPRPHTGLGLSAYLAYGVVQHDEDPDVRGRALACCFGAGVVLAVLAVTRMGNALMKFIPTHIKLATVVGMGMLLAFIGTQNIRLVVRDPDTLVTLVRGDPLPRPPAVAVITAFAAVAAVIAPPPSRSHAGAAL